MSILPYIVDKAEEYGLRKYPRMTARGEIRVCCPFCGDDTKYHCYLNPTENIFHCFRCGASGGVARFIAWIENRSELEVLDEYRQKAGVNRKKTVHPAERLTAHQYRLMGFKKPQYEKMTPEMKARILERMWGYWKAFEERKVRIAFLCYLYGLYTQQPHKAKRWVEEMEKETGLQLWQKCQKLYQLPRDQWEEWQFEMVNWATGLIAYAYAEGEEFHGKEEMVV